MSQDTTYKSHLANSGVILFIVLAYIVMRINGVDGGEYCHKVETWKASLA